MTSLFGQELSPAMTALVYIVLALALLILGGSIYYYWSYARKIERFLARDNVNNNMMRQDLVDRCVSHRLYRARERRQRLRIALAALGEHAQATEKAE